MKIRIRQQDTGSINAALDREGKFTITGNQGLAGTTVITPDFIRRQAFNARRRTCRAGTGQKYHPALVAFPFSATDAFKRYPGMPQGIQHRGIFRNHHDFIHRMKDNAGGVSHTLPQVHGDREFFSGRRAW
jgi:hypothetical protein